MQTTSPPVEHPVTRLTYEPNTGRAIITQCSYDDQWTQLERAINEGIGRHHWRTKTVSVDAYIDEADIPKFVRGRFGNRCWIAKRQGFHVVGGRDVVTYSVEVLDPEHV